MAATSETITDFNNIPGKLIDVGGVKIHEFPSIVSQTSCGKERFWTMYVAAEKNGQKISIHKDWYSSSGNPKHLVNINFNDIITFYFTRQGQKNGKISTSARTYVKNGSNIGKSNETNVFTQALRDAYSKWKHKNKKSNYSGFKPPQLVVNLKDNIDRIDFSKYQYTINRKYDGVRCLATVRPGIDYPKEFTDIVMYSRERHEFPDKYNDHRRIILEMINTLESNPASKIKWEKGRTLDGEIYAHGVSLQNISGSSRNTNITNIENKLVYVVFDTFVQNYENKKVDEYNVGYSDRLKYINDLFEIYYSQKPNDNNFIEKGESNPKVQLAPTWKATSMDQVDKMYNDFVKSKYEGLILRRDDSPYIFSWSGYRNNGILRMKPVHTAEYPCIGYTDGQGKDKGAIIYICALSMMEPGINTTFNVMPKNMTDEERKERFIQASRIEANGKTHFMNKYYSIPYTVEYQDLSDKGIPIRAKGIAFRDYE